MTNEEIENSISLIFHKLNVIEIKLHGFLKVQEKLELLKSDLENILMSSKNARD